MSFAWLRPIGKWVIEAIVREIVAKMDSEDPPPVPPKPAPR